MGVFFFGDFGCCSSTASSSAVVANFSICLGCGVSVLVSVSLSVTASATDSATAFFFFLALLVPPAIGVSDRLFFSSFFAVPRDSVLPRGAVFGVDFALTGVEDALTGVGFELPGIFFRALARV